MTQSILALLTALYILVGPWMADGAFAQKRGGILTMTMIDSPGGLSVLEEATYYSTSPMAGVFNNLIMFDQHAKQNRLETIVPDLATSWSWSSDGLALTMPLHPGVKWHDGRPFTSKDVLCTWDLLMEKSADKLRVNPRKANYRNLERVSANGDYEVTFHLKRPQPAFPILLASGVSVIYPCHVKASEMRTHPVGTGPFKFVEFKPNEYIKVVRNLDYWKPGRPYLDGVEYKIIRDPATAALAFMAGTVDMTFPYQLTVPVYKNIKSQMPGAICELTPDGGVNRHLLINRDTPPFDNPDLRLAMAMSIDRQAFVDIVTEGQGEIGGALQPPPGGMWGMPASMVKGLPGYDPDVTKNREQAMGLMRKLGYGPDNRLKIKLLVRDNTFHKTPAILLIDQLRQVYIDSELDVVETPAFYPRLYRKEFTVALNLQTSGPDPDPTLEAFYGCGSTINWDGYCNADVNKMIEQQSMEADQEHRKQMVWAIERKLAEDIVRPIIFYSRQGTCWKPDVKGLTLMENSIFNGNRREDIWLDR